MEDGRNADKGGSCHISLLVSLIICVADRFVPLYVGAKLHTGRTDVTGKGRSIGVLIRECLWRQQGAEAVQRREIRRIRQGTSYGG